MVRREERERKRETFRQFLLVLLRLAALRFGLRVRIRLRIRSSTDRTGTSRGSGSVDYSGFVNTGDKEDHGGDNSDKDTDHKDKKNGFGTLRKDTLDIGDGVVEFTLEDITGRGREGVVWRVKWYVERGREEE